jgi:hypothetical protein
MCAAGGRPYVSSSRRSSNRTCADQRGRLRQSGVFVERRFVERGCVVAAGGFLLGQQRGAMLDVMLDPFGLRCFADASGLPNWGGRDARGGPSEVALESSR